ncbi:MAG: hypothetical protein KatS3mg011_2193 [Acidimicrobiia bacterium]|nr:MAG: hypothetical protein KatS3mg011_2193 [Acidimicrobiia bacterium]
MTIEVEPDADSVHLSYRFDGLPSGLAGPELVLALGRTEIRVDGNDRGEISEPVAVGGHRYRLSGEKAEILIESPLPSQLFARPAEGGVVVWLHWVISPEADYRARLRIVRSTS